MTEQLGRPARRAPSVVFLCVVLFLIYNSNFRLFENADNVPNSLLPFSLLVDHSLYLDEWVQPYTTNGQAVYYVARRDGHWMSVYPVIVPLVISPLYVFPTWWLSRHNPPVPRDSYVYFTIIHTMEKLSASLLAALSGGLLYLSLKNILTPARSLAIALVYALASNTWSISSQALWRQGFSECAFALLLWALLRGREAASHPFWVGLALALAAANKPAHAVFALAFLAYFGLTSRKSLPLLCAPLLAIGIAVLAYNLHFFRSLLGAYPNPLATDYRSPDPWMRRWEGPAGLLVSPNRGLFIFIPWTVLAVWGAIRAWKENRRGWERYLIGAMFVSFLIQARFGWWAGGMCYGPRYLTDLLPFLAFFLVPVWSRVQVGPLMRTAFLAAVVSAFWIQIVGAYYYPSGRWDWEPGRVTLNPKRVWDWSDNQIMRSWKAGPAEPQLLIDWWVLLKTNPAASGVAQPSAYLRNKIWRDTPVGAPLPAPRAAGLRPREPESGTGKPLQAGRLYSNAAAPMSAPPIGGQKPPLQKGASQCFEDVP